MIASLLLAALSFAHNVVDKPITGDSVAVDDLLFERTYGGFGRQVGNAVLVRADGGYVVIGYADDDNVGDGSRDADVVVLGMDPAGEVLWRTRIGAAGEDFGWDIIASGDGYLLTGFTQSSGAGGYDVLLARLNREGDVEWERAFGTKGNERAWSLVDDGAGGCVIAGESAPVGSASRDVFLLRVDAAGELAWQFSPTRDGDDRAFEVARTSNGFVFVGTTTTDSAGARDALILHMDPSGRLVRRTRLGGTQDDVAHGVLAIGAEVLVTGYGASYSEGAHNDALLWRLAENGDVLWRREFGGPGDDRAMTSAADERGGYWVVGYSRKLAEWDATITRVDADGRVIKRVVVVRPGNDRGVDVASLPKAGCIVAGMRGGVSEELWLFAPATND